MAHYPNDKPEVDIWDVWMEEETKMAYCLYIDLQMKIKNNKTSNLRLAESPYNDHNTKI